MTQTVLLTLGRLPKALEIARALKSVGCRVLIAEPYKRHLSSPSRHVDACFQVPAPVDGEAAYLEALLEIVKAEGVARVVTVSEEAMFSAGLADHLPRGTVLFGPGKALIRSLHDKAAFVERARGLGLAVPDSALLGTPEARELAARTATVRKHVFSSAGVGVEFAEAGASLPAPGPRATLVQERLAGAARNSVSLCWQGRVLGTVVYEGTVMSHTVSVAFRRIEAPEIEAWVDTFAEGVGYSGFLAFDFIDDAGGAPHAIECNPRANSGVHFFDPAWLARAVLSPAEVGAAAHKPARLMQQFYPCLTETQASVFDSKLRRRNWHFLRRSKDVTWDANDPWPFILMTFTSWEILKRSVFKGESFGEAAVADISWLGEP